LGKLTEYFEILKKLFFPFAFKQIGCDNCPRWFHHSCLNMADAHANDAKQMPKWKCPVCNWVGCFCFYFSNL